MGPRGSIRRGGPENPAMTPSRTAHDRRPHPPPDADEFPQLSRGEPRHRSSLVVLTGANGAGKTNLIEAISLLTPGRGLRRATLEEVAFSEGDGSWAVSAEIEGMLGLATLGTGIEPPAAEDARRAAACRIDREPVGSAGGLRRSSARGVADAGDGPAVQRAGFGAPALPRPPGARRRRPAFQPRLGARARAALAQPAAGGAAPRPALARRDRARDRRSSRSRSRPAAPRRCGACRARWRAARTMPSRPPRSRSTAGWSGCCRTIPRPRSRIATAPC